MFHIEARGWAFPPLQGQSLDAGCPKVRSGLRGVSSLQLKAVPGEGLSCEPPAVGGPGSQENEGMPGSCRGNWVLHSASSYSRR